jgi:hypothetical protein
MERTTRRIDQNKRKYDSIDLIRENALVQDIASKSALIEKGEGVLRGLDESLVQSNSGSSGAPQ